MLEPRPPAPGVPIFRRCGCAATWLALGAVTLLFAPTARGALTITNFGTNRPSAGVVFDPVVGAASTSTTGSGTTGTPPDGGRGQTFLLPDTGDGKTGWNISALYFGLRNDVPTGATFPPAGQNQVTLTLWSWVPSTNGNSTGSWGNGSIYSNTPLFSGTAALPLTSAPPATAYLKFNFGTTVFLPKLAAYGFLLEMNTASNYGLRWTASGTSVYADGRLLTSSNGVTFSTISTQDMEFMVEGNAVASPLRLLMSEGFKSSSYPAGATVLGKTPLGLGYDGAWDGYGTVTGVTNSLVFAGYGADGTNHLRISGNSAGRRALLKGNNGPLGNYQDTDGTVSLSRDTAPLYFSFLVYAPTNTPPLGNFGLFKDDYSPSNRAFQFRLSGTPPFQITTGSDASTAATPVLGTNTGTTNLVVARFDFGVTNDTLSVWLNPVTGGAEPPPNAVLTNLHLAFDRLQTLHTSGDPVDFDELRFANDWTNVTRSSGLSTLPVSQTLVGMRSNPPSPTGGATYPPEFFPFVDEFGQYRYLEWSNKVHSLDELAAAVTNEAAALAAAPGHPEWCDYGGWLNGPLLSATGFFRVQKYQGDWWFVDPHGHLFWSHGVTGGGAPAGSTGVTDRENYFEWLPEAGDPLAVFYGQVASTISGGYYNGTKPVAMDFFGANAQRRYGTNWASLSRDLAHTRLRSWNMNTIGSWADSATYLLHRTPYAVVLYPSVGGNINGNGLFPDYFNPAFATGLTNAVDGPERNDPWCLGFYIFNELEWTRPSALADVKDLGRETLAADSSSYAKAAFRDDLQAKYATNIATLNTAWATAYANWTDFMTNRAVSPVTAGANTDLTNFYRAYAEQFFGTAAAVIHGHSSNLFLGSRFANQPHTDAARACTNYVDVASFNQYNSTVSVLTGLEADIPLLVTEHNFAATNTGLFWLGFNPGIQPADQAGRATKYTAHVNSAINNSRFVGDHWFQLRDRATTGILNSDTDGNNNNGLVDVTDTPQSEIISAVKTSGSLMYSQRLGTTPPTITAISNIVLNEDTTSTAIPFVIGDDITAATSLTLARSSSDTNLIGTAGIVFGGSGSNRTVTLTPLTNASGTATITLTVTDGKGARGFATFDLTVLPVNDPPVLAAISNRTINPGQTLAITNVATDPEVPATQAFTFSFVTNPPGAVLGASNGILTWRPAMAQANSTNPFLVKVADNGTPILAATQQFNVFVTPLTGAVVTAVSFTNTNQLRLLITGGTGPDYTVVASTNLSNWTTLLATNSPTVPFNWTDTNAGSFLKRFYRVLLGP